MMTKMATYKWCRHHHHANTTDATQYMQACVMKLECEFCHLHPVAPPEKQQLNTSISEMMWSLLSQRSNCSVALPFSFPVLKLHSTKVHFII